MSRNYLKNYLANFNNDLERIESLVDFAKTAIKFIIVKKLYPDFLKYSADIMLKEEGLK